MTSSAARLSAALADRYRLERELGQGGMATVYLALDLRHQRRVAIKVFRPELAAVIGAERFLSEIRTTANLQHPHILSLHDSGEADGFLFYVMPYVEGETLRDRMDREKQLPIGDAVRIATEIAGALGYAHRHGVIHRDIKPDNILLHDGSALVADFGIALAVAESGDTRLTETGLSLGTPQYMSPEQAMGERHLDARTDVYALGCVLYEMLCGQAPYTGPTAQAIVAKVMTGEVEPVTSLRRTVPPHVAAAAHVALEKLPADRFPDAEQLAGALANPLFRRGVRPVVPSFPRLAAALAVGAALGLALGFLLWGTRSRPSPEALAARVELGLPAGVVLSLDKDYPVLALSPDGSRLAFVGEEENGRRRLYIRPLGGAGAQAVEASEGALAPFFAPDGSAIGFLAGDLLFQVPAAGGVPAPMYGITGDGVHRGAAWLADSLLVAGTSPNSGLGVRRIQPGQVGGPAGWEMVTANEEFAGWPRAVGTSHDVLFVRNAGGPDNTEVALLSLESGETRTLANRGVSPHYASGHLLYVRGSTLYAMAYDPARREVGGPERELLSGVAAGGLGIAQYAVGGRVLAYVAGTFVPPDFELVWVDRSGRVTGILLQGRQYEVPRLSPDGRRVAVGVVQGSNSDVWTLDIRRGVLEPQTRHSGEDFGPVWAPDGSALAISTEIGEDSGELGPALGMIDGRGGATRKLTSSPEVGAWEFPTSWTPDGKAIILTTRRPGKRSDIEMFSPDGKGELVPLVATVADERGAALSPDGRWLAYVSDRSGSRAVWVQPFPGPGAALQVSTDDGNEPVWSRDARQLFFWSGDDMMVVDVAPGRELRVSAPRRLFSGRFEHIRGMGGQAANYDVSPDGQHFLMVRRTSSVRPRVIHLVLDWPAVLLGQDGSR